MPNTLQHRINQHRMLKDLRLKLLRLHKLLLDAEGNDYEQIHGKVSKGELLQLVISHDQFAWLRQLSQLIVRMDDLLDADEPITVDSITALHHQIRSLLTPNELGSEFAVKYDAALQRNPDVVLAHADVVTLLSAAA